MNCIALHKKVFTLVLLFFNLILFCWIVVWYTYPFVKKKKCWNKIDKIQEHISTSHNFSSMPKLVGVVRSPLLNFTKSKYILHGKETVVMILFKFEISKLNVKIIFWKRNYFPLTNSAYSRSCLDRGERSYWLFNTAGNKKNKTKQMLTSFHFIFVFEQIEKQIL